MSWKLLKAFPKIMVVVATFIISTVLFGLWWYSRTSFQRPSSSPVVDRSREIIQKKAASLPAKMGWLALVGTDLWDISTGEVIFHSWLNETAPQRLFYQPGTNRLMAQYERMTVRYALDGTRDAELYPGSTPFFTPNGKQALYVQAGDIFMAEVDWRNFKFTGERQVTHLGQFYAPFFAVGVALYSENAMIVRNQNKGMYVNLKTGDAKQMQQFGNFAPKVRSADMEVIVSGSENSIGIFDINTKAVKPFPTGHGRAVDIAWLNNDLCAVLVGSDYVIAYSRKAGKVRDITRLPFRCSKLVSPSPSGRYIMATDMKQVVVVDVESRRTIEFGNIANNLEWISDNSLLCSMEVPDSTKRGIWLKKMGEGETRVCPEPYFCGNQPHGAEAVMHEPGLVLFASQTTLYRMLPNGSDLKEVGHLQRPVQRIQTVEKW